MKRPRALFTTWYFAAIVAGAAVILGVFPAMVDCANLRGGGGNIDDLEEILTATAGEWNLQRDGMRRPMNEDEIKEIMTAVIEKKREDMLIGKLKEALNSLTDFIDKKMNKDGNQDIKAPIPDLQPSTDDVVVDPTMNF